MAGRSVASRISLVIAVFLLAACSSEDACEKSASKWESCDIKGGTPAQCTSKEDECVANCVNHSTCADLTDAGTEGDYVKCLLACLAE
jgi:hypothetical protein